MDIGSARALAARVFELRGEGDFRRAREAAALYRSLLADHDPAALADLTSDIDGLDLEMAGALSDPDALRQADAVFERYASRAEPNLPATAAFALRIKVNLLVNARRDEKAIAVAEQLGEFFGAREDAARQDVIAGYVVDVAEMIMSGGAFQVADVLLVAASSRMHGDSSEKGRTVRARAQMLRVVAILYSGESSSLPSALRDLHSGGDDTLIAIDSLLARWADNPFWAGARVSALGNKAVLLGAMGRDADLARTHAALNLAIGEVRGEADLVASADLVLAEILEGLLL